METVRKEAWIDEENSILAFHEIKNSIRIVKPEDLFWGWVMDVIRSGYRIM